MLNNKPTAFGLSARNASTCTCTYCILHQFISNIYHELTSYYSDSFDLLFGVVIFRLRAGFVATEENPASSKGDDVLITTKYTCTCTCR